MVLGLVAGLNPGNVIPPHLDVGQIIRGWDGFSAKTEQLRQQSGAAWIAATYYGVYGELAYHLAASGVPVVAVDRARPLCLCAAARSGASRQAGR